MEGSPLQCPASGAGLRRVPIAEADAAVGARLAPPHAHGYEPVGRTDQVMLRDDHGGAYPVRNGIPVLLVPEMLTREGRSVDIREPRYAEAYEEMAHYDDEGDRAVVEIASSHAARDLLPLTSLTDAQRARFPEPDLRWLDAKYELAAQQDAFRYLAPMTGCRVLQLGGRGLHAVRFLLAGATEAWVISPMLGELRFARALGQLCGVGDRLHCVAGIAEEIPVSSGTFDRIYAQGSLHHWQIGPALRECRRVLAADGRFAAVEPWRGPFYGIGTAVLGKRDRRVRCVVLDADRIEPFAGLFDDASITHHGTLTRYPLIGLSKLGVKLPRSTVARLGRADDGLSSHIPGARARGSSVAIVGRRLSEAEG
jgi:SAM-dependent methyltransferase